MKIKINCTTFASTKHEKGILKKNLYCLATGAPGVAFFYIDWCLKTLFHNRVVFNKIRLLIHRPTKMPHINVNCSMIQIIYIKAMRGKNLVPNAFFLLSFRQTWIRRRSVAESKLVITALLDHRKDTCFICLVFLKRQLDIISWKAKSENVSMSETSAVCRLGLVKRYGQAFWKLQKTEVRWNFINLLYWYVLVAVNYLRW